MARDRNLFRASASSAAALAALLCLSLEPSWAGDDPAHALAQKFSSDGDAPPKPKKKPAAGLTEADRKASAEAKKAQLLVIENKAKARAAEEAARKAEESDMLERARIEAEERREAARKAADQEEAEDRRRAAEEAARKAEDERVAAEARARKDADEAEQKRIAEERRIADEKRVAEEKRAAEERQAAEEKRLAQEKQAAEERRLAEEKHAADEKRLAEEQRAAEEKKLADEQRLAEEKREAEERRLADEKRVAEEKRLADEARIAAETKAADDAAEKRLAEQRLRALERDREEEARRLTQKLTRIAEERAKREAAANKVDSEKHEKDTAAATPPAPALSVVAEPKTSPPPTLPKYETAAEPLPSLARVTILLVMEPGTNGIRRYGKKTADPILCAGESCWVGAGPDRDATRMTRGRAIGPGNTLGHRAGACNQKLACVFRDIDLSSGPQALQPIDLRVMRHDRREPATISSAGRCDLVGSELVCADTIKSRSWRAWIVPESVAERAGAEALERAVEAGLPSSRSAELKSMARQ